MGIGAVSGREQQQQVVVTAFPLFMLGEDLKANDISSSLIITTDVNVTIIPEYTIVSSIHTPLLNGQNI
jgi:hypothetical protein